MELAREPAVRLLPVLHLRQPLRAEPAAGGARPQHLQLPAALRRGGVRAAPRGLLHDVRVHLPRPPAAEGARHPVSVLLVPGTCTAVLPQYYVITTLFSLDGYSDVAAVQQLSVPGVHPLAAV